MTRMSASERVQAALRGEPVDYPPVSLWHHFPEHEQSAGAIAEATLAAQAERARLVKLRYDNGSAPYFEVLDAQRDLLTAEQQWVQTRRALLSSRVSLYAALGGGSQEFVELPAPEGRPAN